MDRRIRLIYEYMNVPEKIETVRLLKKEKEELNFELDRNKELYSHKLIKQILNDTLDKWELEIKELEYDIKNNIGPIRK
ncbi:hypothetical protein [Bacillus sp. AFS053548]|uniref:hypothetical protein n=1 Tax=Bacillus sp. AFS053548 TaxID=2033505 RepID=UPI000BFDA7F0|nr:hypothetical protein [Bacillus sp. AFS053548]PGM54192.1 hypothetical protein CN946_16455 [Bacillus sp. AFS053548]